MKLFTSLFKGLVVETVEAIVEQQFHAETEIRQFGNSIFRYVVEILILT